jgi:glycosyltransferase involved in cell wall biosynthesis
MTEQTPENNIPEFSVLMSLYIREKAEYFTQCMESILCQTMLPQEIVIVKDGPLTDALETVLEEYQKKYPDVIKVISLPENRGLGLALAEGIEHCSCEIVARMDTDDIARRDRFERQLAEFHQDPELDICGSHIIEFEDQIENVLSVRKVPLTNDEIAEYQKQRSAFNHMTVMYKKSAVQKAGNYQDAPLMEDDFLWVHMLQTGARCKNIDDTLVYARTGYAMIERRGGFSYFRKYCQGRRKILETGYISRWDYYKTLGVQGIVAFVPKKVRLLVFTKLLRKM